MRIAYIHTNDLAKNETSETFVIQHANSLAEAGAEVFLFLINSSNEDPESIITLKFDWSAIHENLKIKCFKVQGRSKSKYYNWVANEVGSLDSCMVITRHHGVLRSLLRNKLAKHRYFFETHDFFMDLSIRDDVSLKKRWKQWWIERTRFHQLDGLLHLNSHQRALYEKRLPNVPKGVFPTGLVVQEKLFEERENRVVYIGSLNPRLGLNWLVELASSLPEEIEFWIIAGKTEDEIIDFKNRFENSTLPPNVVITGWVDKKELKEIISKAKIGLLPLADTFFNRFLTVPLKLLDYIAFGIPVISTRHPSIEEFLTKGVTGEFVNWSETEEVVTSIVELISDETKWDKMNSNLFQKAKGLEWTNRAKKEIEFLSHVE